MSEPIPPFDAYRLADALDHHDLRLLHDRYADICTRRAFDELAGIFTPDATVTLDLIERDLVVNGPGELGGFIGAQLEQFDFFMFAVRGSWFELRVGGDADAAAGRMWMSEFRHHTADDEWSTIFGLYQDRYRRTDDGWRIERRRYRSLARPQAGQVFELDVVALEDL